MTELVDLTAVEQRRLIGTKAVSATELLDAHLARIEAVNPTVNAIVAYDPDVGRARARNIDDAVAAGHDPGLLGGLVTAHKDLEETAVEGLQGLVDRLDGSAAQVRRDPLAPALATR